LSFVLIAAEHGSRLRSGFCSPGQMPGARVTRPGFPRGASFDRRRSCVIHSLAFEVQHQDDDCHGGCKNDEWLNDRPEYNTHRLQKGPRNLSAGRVVLIPQCFTQLRTATFRIAQAGRRRKASHWPRILFGPHSDSDGSKSNTSIKLPVPFLRSKAEPTGSLRSGMISGS